MKVDDVDDLDEKRHKLYIDNVHKCAKIGPAVYSTFVIVHFVTDERTHARMNVHTGPTSITPLNAVGTV